MRANTKKTSENSQTGTKAAGERKVSSIKYAIYKFYIFLLYGRTVIKAGLEANTERQ